MKTLYDGKTKTVKLNEETGVVYLFFKDSATGENGVFDPGSNSVGGSVDGSGLWHCGGAVTGVAGSKGGNSPPTDWEIAFMPVERRGNAVSGTGCSTAGGDPSEYYGIFESAEIWGFGHAS